MRLFFPIALGISNEEQRRLQELAWETILAHRRPRSVFGHSRGNLRDQDFAPGPALTLGIGKYASIPYFPGLNVSRLTIAVEAYRSDWSVATSAREVLVSKPGAYELRHDGQNLEALVHTDEDPTPLIYPTAGLSPGWHQLALTYDGTIHAMWIDATLVASGTTHGDLRYASPAMNDARFSAMAIGVNSVDTATTGKPPSFPFTGALAVVRLVDRALTQQSWASSDSRAHSSERGPTSRHGSDARERGADSEHSDEVREVLDRSDRALPISRAQTDTQRSSKPAAFRPSSATVRSTGIRSSST